MFDDIPDNYKPQTASDPRRGMALHAGRQDRAPAARAAHARPRGALHQPRGEGGARQSRTAVSFSTSPGSRRSAPMRRRTSSASCRACTTSSRSWPTSTSRRNRWRSGRPRTTSWAASGWMPTRRNRPSRGCSPRASAPPDINGANRLGGNSLSDLIVFGKRAGEYAAAVRARSGRRAAGRAGRRTSHARVRWSHSIAAARARTPTPCRPTSRRRCRRWSASSAPKPRWWKRSGTWIAAGARQPCGRRRSPRVQRRLAHLPRPPQPARRVRGHHAVGARAQGEPRRPLPRGLPGQGRPSTGRSTSRHGGCPTGRCRWRACRLPPMPAELKQIVEEQKQ